MKIRDQALSGYKYNLMDQLICEYTVAPLIHACRLRQRQSEKKKKKKTHRIRRDWWYHYFIKHAAVKRILI